MDIIKHKKILEVLKEEDIELDAAFKDFLKNASYVKELSTVLHGFIFDLERFEQQGFRTGKSALEGRINDAERILKTDRKQINTDLRYMRKILRELLRISKILIDDKHKTKFRINTS
ncbi:hypothetical protein HOD20_10045 [archaeon]|jgi:hypothetical protein|nr:hypothetical protein [Candidatus Woesearchaeota archaeon]MBT4352851.1 hypothetical protein [archaeon]MBT4647979.1 hypothetical protein [archaeon]MBT6822644.1 hypothetical protein [archaeon]MBT7391559.1 hypothetical protein [archaeon]